MLNGQRLFGLFFCLLLLFLLKVTGPAQAYGYDDKDVGTPNYWQRQPDTNFVEGGKWYCGPAAVSNALIWLGKHGFPKLIPAASNEFSAQTRMIEILASDQFMGTGDYSGTKLPRLINGVRKYIIACGYPIKSLQYKGISKCPEQFLAGNTTDLNWMVENTAGLTGQCLGVGWYKYDRSANIYRRTGGHYVTLVGYERDGNDGRAPYALIVHNPATGQRSRVYMQQLTSGTLVRQDKQGNTTAPTISAAGLYMVTEGLDPRKLGIIEGALVFKL